MSPATADNATFFAWLTPPGTAAIATLAVRGPRTWSIVRELFMPLSAQALAESPPDDTGCFWLGWLGGAARGERDEVVLALTRAGPMPWVEIHCHGGRQVAVLLEELFVQKGARACTWQELEQRTADWAGRVEALAMLTRAPTARTAAVLLDQYHGAFDRAGAGIASAVQRQDLAEAGRLLDELARFAPVGRHLTDPWRVAILGAPNVGKSSLANCLAGFQRSVVSPVPGTTRDVVASRLAIDGWPVELVDTAGWRESPDRLERQGIDLARQAAAGADLSLWVLDAAAPPEWPTTELPGLHFIINKIDLPAAWELGRAAEAVHLSALTGAGLAALIETLAHWLVPEPPPAGAAVPYTTALCQQVEDARHCWVGGRQAEALELLGCIRPAPPGP